MKINKIDTTRLRNDAHFQFHADIIALITGAGAEDFVNTANETIHRYASLRHRHRHGTHISTALDDRGGESSGDDATEGSN